MLFLRKFRAIYINSSHTGSNYICSQYLKWCFDFTVINFLFCTDFDKTTNIFSFYRKITDFSLYFEKSPWPRIIAIFLNNILLEVNTFPSLLKSSSTLGATLTFNLLRTAWHGIFISKVYIESCCWHTIFLNLLYFSMEK